MSKKLMAIAAAVALGASALVAAPAHANTFTYAIDAQASATPIADGGAATALTAALHTSPETNVIQWSGAVLRATNTAVRYVLTVTVGQVIKVTSSPTVKLLDSLTVSGAAAKTTNGSNELNVTATTGSYTFWAFTTSTTPGTVSITSGLNTKTTFVASSVGTSYNIESTKLPTSVATSADADLFVKVTDVFGNEITNLNNTAKGIDGISNAFSLTTSRLTTTLVGATFKSPSVTDAWAWDATEKMWKQTITASANGGPIAIRMDLATTDYKVGFAAPKISAFTSFSAADLAAQVKTLTTQVTALQAQLAALQIIKDRKVSKLKYNRLARKWNSAFPSNKVWVKP